jgi:hypothetical protein
MDNRIRLFIIIIGGFSLQSCATVSNKNATHNPIQFEDENVSSILSFNGPQWVDLSIQNKSNSVLQLNVDLSSFTTATGSNSKLVPEGTKYITADETQPPAVIPPNGKYKKLYSSANAMYYASGQYGGWRTTNWIPDNLNGSTFIFAYKTNGEDKYITFSGNEYLPNANEVLGTVTVEKRFWNIFFMPAVDKRRETLYNLALQDARLKYGADITLTNLHYLGSWSPASLVLYFSIIGFVENASLTADVVKD